MISPFRLTLNPAWLPALANLAPQPMGVLSPWRGLEALPPPLPEVARQSLLAEGLLDASGAVSPALSAILNLLAAPAASLHLHFANSEKLLDYRLYFSGLEDESASLLQTADGLALTAPARPNDLLSALRQHTGESLLQPVSFSADLPLTEALALAALLDRRRQARLFSIASQSELENSALSPILIAERLPAYTDSSRWLTAILQQAAGLQTLPDPDHLSAALQSLAHRGLAVPLEESYLLAESPASLADHLLLFENKIHLAACRANPEGDLNRADFIYLQSGVSSLLRLELLPGLVRFEAIPAATLLDGVEYYLTHPTALPMPPSKPAAWKLGLVAGGGIAQEYELTGTVKIGRGSDCEIQISDPRSSRQNSIIELVEGGYEINDLGSTNGTYLNHLRLTGPQRLQDGDLIRIGETYLKVISSRSTAATAPTPRSRGDESPTDPEIIEPEPEPEPASDLLPGESETAEPPPADLPAWLYSPPGATLQLPEEPGEEGLAESNQEEPEAPVSEPLAWLYSAQQAQEQAEPPAEGELLASPPAGLEEPTPESAGDVPLEPQPAAEEEPILGETRATPATSEPAPDLNLEPEEPISGVTRKASSGRRHTQQICPTCGASNPLDARFCGTCGARLQ